MLDRAFYNIESTTMTEQQQKMGIVPTSNDPELKLECDVITLDEILKQLYEFQPLVGDFHLEGIIEYLKNMIWFLTLQYVLSSLSLIILASLIQGTQKDKQSESFLNWAQNDNHNFQIQKEQPLFIAFAVFFAMQFCLLLFIRLKSKWIQSIDS